MVVVVELTLVALIGLKVVIAASFCCSLFLHVMFGPHISGVSQLWTLLAIDSIYDYWWPASRLAGWGASLTYLSLL